LHRVLHSAARTSSKFSRNHFIQPRNKLLLRLDVGSIPPFSSLAAKDRSPFASYLQVDCRSIGQVVQIHRVAGFGNSHFDLRALVPFVKGCYRDEIRPGLQRGAQRGFVIFAVDAVSRVLEVPGSNARVDVPGAHAGDEYQVVVFTERFQRVPVPLSGPVGKPIRRKVGVDAIETGGQDVPLVFLLDQQRDEDGVVPRVPDAVTLRVFEQFGPLLRVHQIRVVHVEEGKKLAGVGSVLEESRVLPVPERRRETTEDK